jgi:hypothetical protein
MTMNGDESEVSPVASNLIPVYRRLIPPAGGQPIWWFAGVRMGHAINGFIATYEALSNAAHSLNAARVCRLGGGFGFLPLTDEVARLEDPASEFAQFHRLTEPMVAWALAQSHRFPIAYIETDYFGGDGAQASVMWRNGSVDFGPIETVDDHAHRTPLEKGAINQAVRRLGVQRGNALDEFEALGLGNFRDNEDWTSEADLDGAK